MRIIYSPEAIEDLLSTLTYIAERNPGAAERLEERVFALVDKLAERAGARAVLRLAWPVAPRFRLGRLWTAPLSMQTPEPRPSCPDGAVPRRRAWELRHCSPVAPRPIVPSRSSHLRPSRTNRARSLRSISNGVTHLMRRPMQASGILIFFVEFDATSCVTTVWPWASACATR